MKVVLVALAGAAGALTRYGIGTAVGPRAFPLSTLGINLVGSFALWFLLRIGDLRGWSELAIVALGVGFLGAFTTFSTFSVETQSMLRDGRGGAAALYVTASVVGGVGLAAAGYVIASAVRGA
jgi:fluoride exporter